MARAAALGVATLALAAGAHVAAGGGLPSMTILAILAAPVSVAAVALTGRRCGPVLLLSSMSISQVLLNKALKALTVEVPDDMAGQVLDAPILAMGAQTMADGSVTMTAAHVVATVVTALLLARAEQALWQLVCRLLPALPSERVVVGRRPLRTPTFFSVPALVPSVASGGPGLRGPPLRFAAA
ncbi:MAG TPA: hypothetical protein VN712_07525 [Dermatophilaceae bacterium]|nr:hypothetical protein [Dermatophilaceae bacterium]